MIKPVAVFGAAVVALALLTGPVQADVARTAVQPVSVAQRPVVGATLTVTPSTWNPQPDARSYEWLRNGEDAVIARGPSYRVARADLGSSLTVVERVSFGGDRDDSSFATTKVVAGLTAPRAAVSGTPRAGEVLTVRLVGGTSGASSSVQWLRDGRAVAGATRSTFTLSRTDAGRRLGVRVVTSRSGYPSVTTQSGAAAVAAVTTGRPSLKGTATVGKKLKVRSRGTWTAPGYRYRYQWLRNGTTIRGATKSSYRLRTKDRRKRISLRVVASRSGFPTVAATSSATKKVR